MPGDHVASAPVASPSSFRDPAGYVVRHEGLVKRIVTWRGRADFDQYVESGLHGELLRAGLVLEHRDEPPMKPHGSMYRCIVPDQLRFVSYPYEWAFDQLRDAALLTLDIQERALRHGMTLKDASAFNVQFDGCRPVFIDALSFTHASAGEWVAYEQFCRHFLVPLLLLEHGRADDLGMFRADLDGPSVRAGSARLPGRTWLNPGALIHVHLHALCSGGFDGAAGARIGKVKRPDRMLLALVDSLRRAVLRTRPPRPNASSWLRYREIRQHYSNPALAQKRRAVAEWIGSRRPSMVYDFGANTGEFSLLAAAGGATCVAFDSDQHCIGEVYRGGRGKPGWILPLVMNLANPSPGLGFAHAERMSLAERGRADLALFLGLIHHLRIRHRLPLRPLGEFVSQLAASVIVEWVPASDPMVQSMNLLPSDREDWTPEALCRAWAPWFRLERSESLPGGRGLLFLVPAA